MWKSVGLESDKMMYEASTGGEIRSVLKTTGATKIQTMFYLTVKLLTPIVVCGDSLVRGNGGEDLGAGGKLLHGAWKAVDDRVKFLGLLLVEHLAKEQT